MTRPTASRVCPECAAERPLRDFRRWHGAYRVLHEVCNLCRPERKLSEMSDRERTDVINLRQLSYRAIERINRSVEYRKRLSRSDAMRRSTHMRKLDRIRNWNAAIGDAVREELETANRKRDSYRNMASLYNDPNPKIHLSRAQTAARLRHGAWAADTWIPFYTRYAEILERVRDQIKYRANIVGNPVTPTEEETKLETYITPEEILELKNLYTQGTVIPGLRHRIPWVIEGRYAKTKQRRKSTGTNVPINNEGESK